MTIRTHRGDLPDGYEPGSAVAIDTETLGLNPARDRLCVVQLSTGDGTADVVQIARGQTRAPNLERLLLDHAVTKLFHYARFDVAVLYKTFAAMAEPVYCTKIASKLARTYTDRHGLKDLVRELLGLEISKQQQSSDWGADTLSEAQLTYAAVRRTAPPPPARPARRHAGARRTRRLRSGGVRLPTHARPARPRRLGRDRHLLARLSDAGADRRRAAALSSPLSRRTPRGMNAGASSRQHG